MKKLSDMVDTFQEVRAIRKELKVMVERLEKCALMYEKGGIYDIITNVSELHDIVSDLEQKIGDEPI